MIVLEMTLDARGLSCPEPVLQSKKAIESLSSGRSIEVIVDTATSRENVTRLAHALSCAVETRQAEDGSFVLTVRKDD